MKTIAGKITSSAPVSISKAASIISTFVSAETGASQAICAYLRRANAAFDELVRLHSKSDRRKLSRQNLSHTHRVEVNEGQPSQAELSHEVETDVKMERKKKKEKKEKNEEKGDFGNFVDNDESKMINEGNLGEAIDRQKHKKKEEREKERGSVGGFEENGGEVVGIEGEGGGKLVIKEEGKTKKRKNGEGVEEIKDGSEEQQHKKRRRRSGEGDN